MNTFAEMVLAPPTLVWIPSASPVDARDDTQYDARHDARYGERPNVQNRAKHEHNVDAEEETIARVLDGDANAFNSLVITYQNFAYGIAVRLLHSPEAAGDAVQDSFVKAFRSLYTFRKGAFKSWFARIVVNTCYDLLRANRRVRWESIGGDEGYGPDLNAGENAAIQLASDHESPQEFVERLELHARIELGLRALPVRQRLVVVLYDIYGYSYEEICEITNLPAGTVKSSICRGRLRLRDFLLEQPELLPRRFVAK